MTQDEIIEMAQECGLVGMRPHLDGIYIESLLAFAKLVAEAERERIKQDNAPEIEKINAYIEHAMRETQRLGQEIEQERNFCHRCGKRTKDIHTCTPPKENT